METPILQFGTSRFLQAHADLFVGEAMKTGAALGPITVVQTTDSRERSGRLAALAAPGGFPVHIKGKKDGRVIDEVIRVESVRRALSALGQWDDVETIFAGEAKVVICNTADRGYDIAHEAGAMPDGVPASFPGKLTKLLFARFRETGETLTILPAELVPQNGERLRDIVATLAAAWRLEDAFLDWLDARAVFCNTLVDRIVSEPLEPAGAVAEPYALWAIQSRPGQVLPCRHPDIVVAPDIGRYEQLKLFILNLGHTFLAERWRTAELDRDMTVKSLLARPEMRAALERLYAEEVVPGFALMGMEDAAKTYVRQTIERFDNPFLAHRLVDIVDNHAEKIRRRMGGFLAWSGAGAPCLRQILDKAA
ncbi:MAG: mannitol dehydrogenase family protein [Rhizobiaceae bacterium]|nr:mannitol dehydrogenase family protein [Rhizobiaceae bacterium]